MDEKEISLKEIFEVIWKRKYFIIICAISLFIVAGIGSFVYDKTKSQVSTIVTFQWNGVNKGEYPDESRFDYNEAIESYVLTLAIEESNLELLASDVRRNLTITPIFSGVTLSLIEKSLRDGIPLSYYASNYKLTLINSELGISVEESSKLLNNIIGQFRLDFERKYINQTVVLDYTKGDYSILDYIESYEVLSSQVDLVEGIMEEKITQYNSFVSPTLNIRFNDILVATKLLSTIEIDQIASRTNTYLLTKDEDYYVTRLLFDIEEKKLELDKNLDMEADTLNLINNYGGSLTTILVPGIDSTQVLKIDSFYNTLLENVIEIQANIADLENDIIYFNGLIDKMEGNDPEFFIDDAKRLDEIEKVENLIIAANTKLGVIVELTNTLLKEHNLVLTSNIIKPLMAPQYESNVSVLLISAIGLVIGAGVGVVYVLFKHDWQ